MLTQRPWWSSTIVLVIALVLMWGLSWSAIKIGVGYAPPVLFSGLRVLIGGLLLIPVAVAGRRSPAFRQHWRTYCISSVFNVIVFFGLQTIASEYLPSGLVSVLVYLQPILVGIIAWMWLGEALHPVKVIGLILGFLGVASVSVESLFGRTSGVGMLIAIAAGVGWAIGTVYSKQVQSRVPMMWLVCIQFLIGGVVLLLGGTALESWRSVHLTTPFILSLLYLSAIGASLSWATWFTLVHRGEVSKVSSYVFMVPILSVFIGVLFLHEHFTIYLVIGLLCVALGIYLVNRPRSSQRADAATSASEAVQE